ncbi:hypothetical protein [Flavobacterium sp. '19STA2R22 D10 B1']|uniref:hypothetical protein n=1 Tax=Flavobacterium aerium TaxID=3037261 RepID=UPI00278C7F7F|nr:hypothetical protein [Flavobacterium sp. '19STA2R22 D10 B1']
MKTIKIVILLFAFSNCYGQQPNVYGKSPLDLEQFSFDLNVATFYPKKYILKNNPEYYEIPIHNNLGLEKKVQLIKKDTLFTKYDVFSDLSFEKDKVPRWIVYNRKNYSNFDTLATYGKYTFQALNILTTLDQKVAIINGLMGYIDQKDANEFIQYLNTKYGKAIKTEGKFIEKTDVYTWETNDRILKYCIAFQEEKNTLVIEVDKDNKTLKNGEKNPHFEAYFFILKKEYAPQLIGKIDSSDFLYCD